MSKQCFAADFERHEKKYMLDALQWAALGRSLARYMQTDLYGRYTICSLYYDTDDYRLIRHSLDKPVYKEKLRLRSYGVPARDTDVFLELKKKLRGVTYKRRVCLPLVQAQAYLDRGAPPPDQGQIFGEIDGFVRRFALAPKVVLCYDRIALTGREDPQLRLTVDANIRFRDWDLDLRLGDHGLLLVEPGRLLMEIKTMGALPLWLSDLLSELQIYPRSFSKYGAAYTRHLVHHFSHSAAQQEVMFHAG